MADTLNIEVDRLDPSCYGGALLPGDGALLSGFPHEKVWFGEPAADARLPQPTDGDGKPTDLDALRESILRVRKALKNIIAENAPAEGWSDEDANRIAAQAELIFFRAVERGANTAGATHLAIALAQRAHAAWSIMSAADRDEERR